MRALRWSSSLYDPYKNAFSTFTEKYPNPQVITVSAAAQPKSGKQTSNSNGFKVGCLSIDLRQ